MKTRENYKDGQYNGLVETFYEDGTLKSKENYKDGEKYGLSETFHTDSTLETIENYKDGKLDGFYMWNTVMGNGERKEGFYKGGKLDGLSIWVTNGRTWSSICWENGIKVSMSKCQN